MKCHSLLRLLCIRDEGTAAAAHEVAERAVDAGTLFDASVEEGVSNASVEAHTDAGEEALPDASVEAHPDAGVEAHPDASEEALPDASVEAHPDAGVEAHPDSGEEALPATGVHALPDEMLMLVFSMLADGPTLLDVVPLVCKRWCRVARDPSSWARVRLAVRQGTPDEYRVLLHAPAAKSLEIGTWDRKTAAQLLPVSSFLCRALRRSRVQVDNASIRIDGGACGRGHAEAAVSHFLVRRPGLRSLRLHLSWPDTAAILRAIAMLRGLRKLEIMKAGQVEAARFARYDGVLAGALPDLRELRVYALDKYGFGSWPGLVSDLARGATALRVLEVDMPVGADRDAVLQLRGLEHVHVHVFKDASEPQATADVVREAFAFLLQMDMTTLQSVVIWLCRGAKSFNWLRELNQSRKVAEEFYPAMPRVEFDAFYGNSTVTNKWYHDIISCREKNRFKDNVKVTLT